MQHIALEKFRDDIVPRLVSRGLMAPQARWSALTGGRTNRLWKVSRPEGDIVVKLFSEPTRNPLFPNDPDSEISVLRYLQSEDLSPCLLDHFEIGPARCLVYAHLPGQPWRAGPEAAAELLHKLHQIAPPMGLRTVPDGSLALEHHARAILSACPEKRRRILDDAAPRGRVAPCGQSRFLHGDPVATNMIQYAGTVRLIDWQCPAIGDPSDDLSVFLSPAMQLTYRGEVLNKREISAFLAAYPDKETVSRYRQLSPWYHWRMAAYCLWQECHGDTNAARAGAAELDALDMAAML